VGQVVDLEDIVEVTYTGDTLLEAIVNQPLVTKAKTLITELTYLDGDTMWAHKWNHVHIQVKVID